MPDNKHTCTECRDTHPTCRRGKGEGRERIGTNRNKNLSTGLQHEGMESNVSLSLQRISQTTEQTEKNMEMINQLLSTPLTNTAHVSMTDLHSHVHSLTRRMFREYE